MLKLSEELHDVDIRMKSKRQKLDQLQDELVDVRKRLDFNEEYTLTLTKGSRLAELKKAMKERQLKVLEGKEDGGDDVMKELRSDIKVIRGDITAYDTRYMYSYS